MRSFAIAIALAASATFAFGQTRDPGSERTQQPAGESGAAVSHTLTPGAAEPHEITTTSRPKVSLTQDQRNRLKAYFAKGGAQKGKADKPAFTVAIGAAVPKQVDLEPFAPELKSILPTYKGDQYVLVDGRMVIATPERRIVAIIPDVRS